MKEQSTGPVLLIGTSFSAAPLLRTLQAAGLHVEVCGNDPCDPCVAWAEQYHQLDYAERDALFDLIQRKRYAAIVPSCNDYAYESAAWVADRLGYPGFDPPEVRATLFDKANFRAFATQHGFPVPRAWTTLSSNTNLTKSAFPLLVKPVDGFSGKGVTRVTTAAELPQAIETARAQSRCGRFVIEQFIEGTLHSHSAFLSGGGIIADCFVDEFCTVYPYAVNCSNSPSRLNERVRARMRECIRELANQLYLIDGLLHTQFIVRDDELFLIECMRRCPGDLYYHLVTFSTGLPYIANYLRPFLGQPMKFFNHTPRNQLWARHTLSVPSDDVVYGFSLRFPFQELQFFPLGDSGRLVHKAPLDKISILFVRFATEKELYSITPRLAEIVELQCNKRKTNDEDGCLI